MTQDDGHQGSSFGHGSSNAGVEDTLEKKDRQKIHSFRAVYENRLRGPTLRGCRSFSCYERLNHIEEGSYGVVFRAREKSTGQIYALKKIKLDNKQMGFPITSLREIHTLIASRPHPNIVRLKEVVVGDILTQVYLVMEFVEHDLKTLLQHMRQPFLISEAKTLMKQLLSAVAFMHDNWLVHRDLKTSNLLLSNRGQLKIADFGLARKFAEPRGQMTQLVVTLWYRAPELLLGSEEYDTAVDMWSVGCIFGELLLSEPLLPGDSELQQLHNIFKLLGHPTTSTWPDFTRLPRSKFINFNIQPFSTLRQRICSQSKVTETGLDLLKGFLLYDPNKRITAASAESHPWFDESPQPKHPDFFNTFPSAAAGEKRAHANTPDAPGHFRDALSQDFQLV